MRKLALAAFGGLFGVLLAAVQAQPAQQQPLTPAAIERAEAVLADTRKAMGGDKLTAVRTIVATGRTRRDRKSVV